MTKVIKGHLPPFDDLDDTPREIKVEKTAGGEDLVNHPPHYNKGGVECIDYIKQQLGHEGFKYYLEGNVIKYLHRWRYKSDDGKQDLEKCKWYLDKLLNLI